MDTHVAKTAAGGTDLAARAAANDHLASDEGFGSGASSPSLAKPFDPDQLLRSVRATLGASPRP